MENLTKKCAFKEHLSIDAIIYCQECKIYMCNKCMIYHQGLLENHHQININKNFKEIFNDLCKEKNHFDKLDYYCKNHNQLCCAKCITKIEGKGNGQHKNCDITFIENIKEEKKNKLKDNLTIMDNSYKDLEESINEIKLLFEKINKTKEELKLNIQKTFTKIRNTINEREDELLLEVDNIYNKEFFKEDLIKNCEKLPNKIKSLLEKGKSINNDWNDDNKLYSIINDCINIENNIKEINIMNDNVKKNNMNNEIKINFIHEDIDNFIQTIKNFGKIFNFNELFDSLILRNTDDLFKFCQLISKQIKLNSTRLLYRSTRDSLNYESYVNKINNKSNLLFLYYTGNKRKFGAYIKTKLEDIQDMKIYKDENAFVFSLDNNKIYKILQPEKAIKFYKNVSQIAIGNTGSYNGFFFNKRTIDDSGLMKNPKIYEFQKNNELTEGFNDLIELEIFEINYN